MKSILITISLVVFVVQVASAQEPDHQQLAQAAGYTAQFTCSATFNAGKTQEQIAVHELINTYDVLELADGIIGKPEINQVEKYVSVTFAENFPPRISAWRPHLGCSALPQGADVDFIENLPKVRLKPKKRDLSNSMWPKGDKLPNEPLPDSINIDGLIDAIDAAFGDEFEGGKFGGSTTAVVVTQNNRLIAERYLEGYDIHTSQRTWSVAKSVAASILGAAVQKGHIKVEDKAKLDAWSLPGDPRNSITIENLLHMGSGLASRPAGNRTDHVYMGGGLVAQYATKNHLEAKPGTRWRYANNDTMLAVRALREKMNNDRRFHAFPFTALLHKIGMFDTVPETDWNGDFVLSSQVWTTARDLARLGQLYLNDGVWDGERILPKGWAEYVAAPAPSQPPNRKGEKSKEPGRGYGAQFWRYENYDGVPNGTYAALGNRGQFLIVVPKYNVVIVRRGYDYRGNYFDGPAFTAEILKNLSRPE